MKERSINHLNMIETPQSFFCYEQVKLCVTRKNLYEPCETHMRLGTALALDTDLV